VGDEFGIGSHDTRWGIRFPQHATTDEVADLIVAVTEHEAAARLPGNVAPRVTAALYARRDRTTAYLGNSNPFTT
jgi:hypothetical protein